MSDRADTVIVGGGVAGFQAAMALRRLWPEKTVTLLDKEEETGYYRTLLPQFINGTLPENKLFFPPSADDRHLRILTAVRVESIDRDKRTLRLSGRGDLHYQRLLIACGGRPLVPQPFVGADCAGIFPVRSLTAARMARQWLTSHPEVVVLGGGLVGVKTAAHLAGYGCSVTLIERDDTLLPQALSAAAAGLVADHLRQKKIRLLLGRTVDDLHSTAGAISAVQVGGDWLPCQTLMVATGSLPDLAWLHDSGLLSEGRLEVAPTLQTADPHIFAAGDAVTIVDSARYTPWTWPQAVVQGALAGENCHAAVPRSLRRYSRVNTMNLNGLSLAILGLPVPGAARAVYAPAGAGIYRELFHQDGTIVGGALVGDISLGGRFHQLMATGLAGERDLESLLVPRKGVWSPQAAVFVRNVRRARILPQGVER